MTLIIQKRVYLEPKYLDQNIMKHLLHKITKETSGECTKEYGHILSVKKIIEIVDNKDTVFTVKFEAETLKPDINSNFTGIVCMVYKDGLFVNVAQKQKMLIPSSTLNGYIFDELSSSYVKEKQKIKEGDEIQVIVTAVKYNKQSFSCVGTLA